MNNFNDLINLFWSCLWIMGCVSSLLITLILIKRMFFGKPTYTTYSNSNKNNKAMDIALFSSITSNSDGGKD
ncbi:hypothetical protein [Bacillus bombysepticus]|uniref:hypothetical protein n=1 Tax=Bacillus bombysepticus TaxID=658666 RepID=UPI003017EDC2|nr:hypothetical protein [Bacillus cereus]MDA2554710.1 hypothetical protein [Bacillus cereus]HDR8500173.1 hypothetical protein [Bacillus cereus]HDR8511542.1 hypothetical protein [Bacillus cereus]HDR8533753.1 hypothetical protein [Bacillus cereus]